MDINGTIISMRTYAECARVVFKVEPNGSDAIRIRDGVAFFYKNDQVCRIAKTFDIYFE